MFKVPQVLTRRERWLIGGFVVVAGVAALVGVRYGRVALFGTSAFVPAPAVIPTTTAQITAALGRNDFAGAIAGADAQLAKDPNNAEALLLKAGALAQQGSLTFNEQTYARQAIAAAQRALGVDASSSEAWRIIGYANEIMQDYPEAHKDYAQSLAFNPQNAVTKFDDAHAWDLQGDRVKAEAGYRAALALAPNLDQAHMGLGRILMAKGDQRGARAEFVQAAALARNIRMRAEADYSAGIVTHALGDDPSAERYLLGATGADASYPLGWAGLGTVLFSKAMSTTSPVSADQRLALVQESLADHDKAIKLNPNQTIAHIQFAAEFAVIGQADQALQILEKTKSIVPNDITLSAPDKAAALRRIAGAESNIKALKDVGY